MAELKKRVLDRLDLNILKTLQSDGRISYVDLAERVGLSSTPCIERVKRLEKEGYIEGYYARLNPQLLNYKMLVFVEISLSSQREEELDAFEEAIRSTPEVMECHLMAGNADYLVKVQCSDVADYERIHRQYLAVLPGVTRLRTSFALRTVVSTTAVDID